MAKKKAIRGKHADQSLVNVEEIARAIRVVRGHRVLIDADLASFYGVTTKALNQAVKRNADRFPADFAFQLSREEFADLRSQSVTSSSGHGGRRSLPLVFTEHGVAMLSSVLNSPAAVRVNIEIMRTFVRLRRLMAAPGELVEQLNRLAETVQVHDGQIKQIVDLLEHMLAEPVKPKRRIGFHAAQKGEAGK